MPEGEFFHVELTMKWSQYLRSRQQHYGLNYTRSDVDKVVFRYHRRTEIVLVGDKEFPRTGDTRILFADVEMLRIARTPSRVILEKGEDVFAEAEIVAVLGGPKADQRPWGSVDPAKPPPTPPQRDPGLFISHASADKLLVDALKTMLQTAVGIAPEEIFYSSGAGTGVPAGQNFVEYIRARMASTTFVLAVITESDRRSEFCLAELDAVWVHADKDFFPLAVKPVDRSTLAATLTSMHVVNLDERPSLIELLERVSKHFGRQYNATAADVAVTTLLDLRRQTVSGL